jgi:aspartyl protease family protein
VTTVLFEKKRLVGTTHVEVRISNPTDRSRGFKQVLIVDTGAYYTIAPARVLREIGIEPYARERFGLADGRAVVREVGAAFFEIEGRVGVAAVIFGKRGDAPLLGVTTLENLGLTIEPLRHVVRPARLMLLGVHGRRARRLAPAAS